MSTGFRQSTLDTIEDVEFLFAHGVGWEEICRRTERRPDTLERLLDRHSRYDLVVRARARDAHLRGTP